MVPTAPDAILPAHSTPTPGAPDAVTAAHSAPTPDAPGAVTGAFSTPTPMEPACLVPERDIEFPAYLVTGADAGDFAGYYLRDTTGAFQSQHTLVGDATRILMLSGTAWQFATVSIPAGPIGPIAMQEFVGQNVATPDLVTEWTKLGSAKSVTVARTVWPPAPAAILPAHTTPTPSAPAAIV